VLGAASALTVCNPNASAVWIPAWADDSEADRGDERRMYWASTNIDGGMRTACSECRRPRALRARLAIPASVLVSLLLTACSAPMPQTALNPHSDYATEGLDLFQIIIVRGVVIGVLVEGVLVWPASRAGGGTW